MERKIYASEQKIHQSTEVLGFLGLSPGDGALAAGQDGRGRQFLRIYKDSVSEEMWKSYCLVLHLSKDVKSFRIYYDPFSPEDIRTDEYAEDGTLLTN